jgi:integrase/recombinase XerD
MDVSDRGVAVNASDLCPTLTWLDAVKAAGRSPKTLASYAAAVATLRSWAQRGDLSDLTRAEAVAFVGWLQERYAPGGVALRVRSLRAGWSWMTDEGLVEKNVFARMRISVPAEAQTTASRDDIEAMLARAGQDHRAAAIIAMLADTGMRRGECAGLELGDVSLREGTVTIRAEISKSKRQRVLAMSTRLRNALRRWLRKRGVGPGGLWASKNPYSLINGVMVRCSKRTLRSHALRRGFAVSWLSEQGSETGLLYAGGWTSTALIRTYTRAVAAELSQSEMRRIVG